FPYIRSLIEGKTDQHYSVDRYKHLHSDIDESLTDIKKLLIKYLDFSDGQNIRRELLHYIFDFQKDLYIHTLIENNILIPTIERFEERLTKENEYIIQAPLSEKSQLSERETDVLRLLLEGLSNKEVADKLFLSTHTVISHRKNITAKTGIKSLAGLTIYAITNGIIRLDNHKKP
ncbi:MAG: LuxR family transcriptional regulator, partial [Paludibacteraceae bacterium]|nr:LuxR family transcriptional regulator [Paludibacteraceae bacterium]